MPLTPDNRKQKRAKLTLVAGGIAALAFAGTYAVVASTGVPASDTSAQTATAASGTGIGVAPTPRPGTPNRSSARAQQPQRAQTHTRTRGS
jgi:hypothetical protein